MTGAFPARPSRAHRFVGAPDGVALSVREWGDPSGPPMLFIHGVMQSHLSFARQFASGELSAFRLVAFDARGHGESGKPTDMAFYGDHVRWAGDIKAVIEALALDRPILVGWSMGGRMIGQYLAEHGDGAIAGLNLVAARVVADARFSGPAVAALPPREEGLAGDIAAATAFLRACFHRQPEPADFAFMLATNMAAWPGLQGAMRAWPARVEETVAALRRVKVPTLISHGALDDVVLPAAAEYAASLIAGSRLSIYDGCGHSPFWENTQRFNGELAAFAARSSRAAG